ncbi:MAG: class I SAM-dependent methyltransferase [Candidatus Sulfotelmatobacter sp.]
MASSSHQPGIFQSARLYWRDVASRSGALAAARGVAAALWEFFRDSTPSRLKSRFGDADYDWNFRVNTTSGAVPWRDRLLGVFHSPYQPTEPGLFREMVDVVEQHARLSEFTFIDLGSGKGRTLLMASDYPFKRIIGVELLPALNQVAEENIATYKSDAQKCFSIESVCSDATAFPLPDGPLLVFLFNPFPEAGLKTAVAHLEDSFRENSRPLIVVYHNPQLEEVFKGGSAWEKIGGTHQYSIFRSKEY